MNLFCPDCQRQLVSFNANGTLTLAGLTEVKSMAEGRIENGEFHRPQDAVVIDATCLRRSCKRKRFIRSVRNRVRGS